MADRLNRKAQKQARMDREKPVDDSLDRMGQEGKYSVFVLCFAQEAPKGYIIVPVKIPNKKEYRRIKRQMLLVRKGLKKTLWFKNAFGNWQSINCKGQVIVSVTPHAVEGRVIETPEGKKKIIIAGEDAPAFN